MVPLELSKDNNQYCKISVFMPNAGSINESVISVTNVGGDSFSVAVSMIRWNANKVFCKLINGTKISNINMYYTKDGLMSKNGFLERSKGNTLDFNDYTISGVWVFSDTGFINGPSVYRGGILLVFKTANGNILQICCDYTNSIFIRIHWGEWKSWARITTVMI